MQLSHFTTSSLVSSTEAELIGYSMKATEDSEVVIRNGDDSSATGIVFVLLGDGKSITNEASIKFTNGLYVDVVSGDVEGAVWVR